MTQTLVFGLSQGAFYALLAAGFVIGYRVTSCVNLAHGVYVAFAVFVAASLTPSMPLAMALLVAVLVTAALGGATESVVLRHAANQPPLSQLLATLGVAIAATGAMRLVWGTDDRTLPGLLGADPISLAGVSLLPSALLVMLALIFVVVTWSLVSRYTLIGRTLLACAEDTTGARLCGVPVARVRFTTAAVAAGTAGLAGVLAAPMTFVTYESGLTFTLLALIVAALGAFRSIPAAVAGGLLLGVVEALTVFYISSQLKTAVTFGVLLALLALRPQGLVSSKVAH